MDKENYTLLDNEIWEDENLSHAEFRVLSYLIRLYRVDYGYSFPKRETLVKKCKIHKDTLSKVLNSLEAKGYITRANNPNKGGRNNIYYIHKYLVIKNKNDVSEEPKQTEPDAKPCEKDAKTSSIESTPEDRSSTPVSENIEGVEASTNELLVKQKAKVIRQLNNDEIEEINKLDTDLLIKAIERANSYKPNGYHIGYIFKTYESVKDESVKNNLPEPTGQDLKDKSNNNSNGNKKSSKGANKEPKPLTRFHGTINEHFRKYTPDELEENLLKMQAAKRKVE